MPLAWVPYADRAEAERRLSGIHDPVSLSLMLKLVNRVEELR